MKELSEAIQQTVDRGVDPKALREVAKAWACYSIQTFDQGLLQEAFKISAAITNFLNEMERNL